MPKVKRTFDSSMTLDELLELLPEARPKANRESRELEDSGSVTIARRRKHPAVTRDVILRLIERLYQK
jgi:hypothetical protein